LNQKQLGKRGEKEAKRKRKRKKGRKRRERYNHTLGSHPKAALGDF
jgi:hypothetical protein